MSRLTFLQRKVVSRAALTGKPKSPVKGKKVQAPAGSSGVAVSLRDVFHRGAYMDSPWLDMDLKFSINFLGGGMTCPT